MVDTYLIIVIKVIASIIGIFAFITLCRFASWLGSAWDAHWPLTDEMTDEMLENDKFKIFWWRKINNGRKS